MWSCNRSCENLILELPWQPESFENWEKLSFAAPLQKGVPVFKFTKELTNKFKRSSVTLSSEGAFGLKIMSEMLKIALFGGLPQYSQFSNLHETDIWS